ncbi:acyl-CoA dehydratase activase-related protein [Selenihalanaerobacter shriftii]|uniref:Predicted nucleotide-binding protein, sugar kinase/HSP70/actin superfamily n=1 Tax=Selenihalanaerobacter shriftii TaxID=142842 RepID=A0A1T4M6P3_9FIRM|nr:acyl-CoA dehydratase activase-related protein [Selenihalanaerobacter shriftii]SJZ62575.1 Predicted nucleotide-binding protein, sugar kinase/HSP70/actin superfamily [Selenihalanaerobacter shriftii]
MTLKVGIPKSLLYFNYYPAWKTFFQELDVEVVESNNSNKNTVNAGVKRAVDEACFPVKICHGHIVDLRDKVDYIFLPRIVSVERSEYVCPKLMGLPDMIKSSLSDLPKLLTPTINRNQNWLSLLKANLKIGANFTDSKFRILKAHWKANHALNNHQKKLIKKIKDKDKLVIGLLGHTYLLYDNYINLGIIDKLEELGVEVITPQNLNQNQIEHGASKLSKSLFWTFNKHIIGAAYYLFNKEEVDGIIQLAAFGCGPDALIGELIERKAKRRKDIHFMSLNLDEHTGEAGLLTRLEAFVDMINWEVKGA